MVKVKNFINCYSIYIVCFFVFCVFFFITTKTPLSGDDWGFYLNSIQSSPIEQAKEFYFSFSGRFFSELWENFGATHKWFWNILNPTLMTIIVLSINRLCNTKDNNKAIIPFVIAAILLSIDDNVRMETYTWMTGEIYIIPLAMVLVYFCLINDFYKKESSLTKNRIVSVLTCVLCFYVGMTMENIAAVFIVGIVMIIIYFYIKKRRIPKLLVTNLILLLISFCIMRMSPGSATRLARDHYEWSQLPVIQKVVTGYPSFLKYTFISNNYLIFFLSFSLILLLFFSNKKQSTVLKITSCIVLLCGTIFVFSFVLPIETNVLLDPESLCSFIFWPVYTIIVLLCLINFLDDKDRLLALFFFVLAGGANMAMMFSPIFGPRSSIYTIFFIICVVVIVVSNTTYPKWLSPLILIVLFSILADRTYEYYYKYNLVGHLQEERLSIIDYYRNNPDVEEAWIPRFAPYTIHGADIEIGDTYHFETFKLFYNLPQDANKIIFFFKDEY